MSGSRDPNTKVTVANQEQTVDANGEVHRGTFTVNTSGRRPLLSGIVNEPVEVETNFNGAVELSGTPDEVLALLKKMRPGK